LSSRWRWDLGSDIERVEGMVFAHHVPDHDHVHDHDAVMPLEDNPIWQQDNVTLHSVGMDIGSSGTQVLFSRLHLRRIGEDLSSRYIVVRRETLYRSPVELTPYLDERTIDGESLGGIIDEAYAAAGVTPERIDTGVVILTGEALRRVNSERITGLLAERGGELVTATAGHNMEAMLAAFGSGAAKRSYDEGMRILNVDIGGGTTKLAVVEAGRVLATAALDVGGRLLVVDADGFIERLDPAGRWHARRAGFDWAVGDRPEPTELERVAEAMADVLVQAVFGPSSDDPADDPYLTEPIHELGDLDGVLLSGGVSEYVYESEDREFGDLGRPLGRAVRARIDDGRLPVPLLPMGERIRATALGASEYSVQLSGNTTIISDPDQLLPRRNLQVLRPEYTLHNDVDPAHIAASIRTHLEAFDAAHPDADIAIALNWTGLPVYGRLRAFGEGLVEGLAKRVTDGHPLYLMLDGDVALSLGSLLREELQVTNPLLVIDGLRLDDFDYIDVGRVRHPSNTVPVTIKSLVFQADPRRGAASGR
jgi:ethanolamine utilization protein EutA